jgi:hypothetical protein
VGCALIAPLLIAEATSQGNRIADLMLRCVTLLLPPADRDQWRRLWQSHLADLILDHRAGLATEEGPISFAVDMMLSTIRRSAHSWFRKLLRLPTPTTLVPAVSAASTASVSFLVGFCLHAFGLNILLSGLAGLAMGMIDFRFRAAIRFSGRRLRVGAPTSPRRLGSRLLGLAGTVIWLVTATAISVILGMALLLDVSRPAILAQLHMNHARAVATKVSRVEANGAPTMSTLRDEVALADKTLNGEIRGTSGSHEPGVGLVAEFDAAAASRYRAELSTFESSLISSIHLAVKSIPMKNGVLAEEQAFSQLADRDPDLRIAEVMLTVLVSLIYLTPEMLSLMTPRRPRID